MVAALSILVNPRSFRAIVTEATKSVSLVYLFGVLDFAAGSAIVLVHNVWTTDWRVLVTLLGWLLVVRGLLRMFAPEQVKAYAATVLRRQNLYTASAVIIGVIGAVLCYFGYR